MERSYKYKMGPGRIVFLIIAVVILILIALVCIMPIWHVMMASISNPTDLNVSKGIILKPLRNVDFTAYKLILQYQPTMLLVEHDIRFQETAGTDVVKI